MNKRVEEAARRIHDRAHLEAKKYSNSHGGSITEEVAYGRGFKAGFIDGYEQAEKDVWDRIEKYLSNRNPTDYATVGWILKNIEEYKKKIMEE